MPRVAASNGVRPEIRALGVIHLNKPVTPAEINSHVGTGEYAAKYISFLKNRYGFDFTVQKDGKTVVSYTCVAEPKNIDELRATQPKAKAAKPAKVVVAKAEKPAKPAKKAAAAAKVKPVKIDKSKSIDIVEKQFGSSGEVATSYSIDGDWDSMDGIDVANFLK